jgi:glucose-1-phosphate thymidylyltransferase
MKGIVLAGGYGTRLFPTTKAVSKQLLPIYDKPTVYYPLSTLMLAGIREILVISSPRDLPQYRSLLEDGSQFGLAFQYLEQPKPEGIAQAFILGRDFIGKEPVFLALGDNLIYGNNMQTMLRDAAELRHGARIFAYRVTDPERYGVVEFDEQKRPISLEEKPAKPKSPWAVTGLYAYGPEVVEYVTQLKPSRRGELEITDLNRLYMERGELGVTFFGRGIAWLDTGTPSAMCEASLFIQALERRQGLKVACLEEIAFMQKWISADQLREQAERLKGCEYGQYLQRVLREELT